MGTPWYRAYLAKAHAELDQFDEAWRNVHEAITAIENSNETWWEADVNRIAGEIARKSEADALTAENYFELPLAVARQQQAKSWELRASMSLAPLWRDQGKVQHAPRTACSGLRVVHGGFRHARSKGSEGVVGGIGVTMLALLICPVAV
jgi:predicted ATPase